MPHLTQRMSRREYADSLYQEAQALYESEVGMQMPSELCYWIEHGIRWAVCEYHIENGDPSKSDLYNDIFKRAAIIGFFWALDAPKGLLGSHSLAICISNFLKKEGSSPALQVSADMVHKTMVLTIKNYVDYGPPRLFEELHRTCAHNWVCDTANHNTNFGTKLCHCQ
jgi:hypothetical protein